MRIELLNKKQLETFLNSDEFKKMPVIPISLQRGLSHIKNPRADPEDILLIITYNPENQMTGYLGLLPDNLFAGGKTYHCAWMSCIWVSKDARGQGVAKKMIKKAYEIWNGNILATEFTSEAYQLYKKLNLFDDFLIKKGLRIYTRFVTAEVFTRKKPWLKVFFPLFKVFDASANLFVGKKWEKQFNRINFTDLIFSENNFSEKTFVTDKNGFCRTTREINWMITYPWLRGYKKNIDKKYHFSSSAKQIKSILVESSQSGNKMLLFVRDSHLKVSFVWGNWHENEIKKILIYAIKTYGISVITSYLSEITEALSNLPYLFQKQQQRRYLIGKKMNTSLPMNFSCFVQDGDGDCGFT